MLEKKCVPCKFPVKFQPTNFKIQDDEMPFGEFVIRYEHKFLRNIHTEKEINDSEHIKDLESYYEIFEDYIEICVGLLALLNNMIRNILNEFVEFNFKGDEINETKNIITKTEIKKFIIKHV